MNRHRWKDLPEITASTIYFAIWAWLTILFWQSLNGAPLQRLQEPCERDGTCWYDAQGYYHRTAQETPSGCPAHYNARACEGYKQSLANAQEAYNYPAVPRPLAVVNTDPAVWMHIDKDGHVVIDGVPDKPQTDTQPHLEGVTLPKRPTRFQRFKKWWATSGAYPFLWGASRDDDSTSAPCSHSNNAGCR